MVVDDRSGQLDGFRQWSGIHDLSGTGIDDLAIFLKRSLTRNTEHISNLLPCPAALTSLPNCCGHQRLGPALNIARCAHGFQRLVLTPQNGSGEDAAQLAVQLLGDRHE